MLAFGDSQNVDVTHKDLELAEKTIYDDHVIYLSKSRRCSLCSQQFRLSHAAAIMQHKDQTGQQRDHVDYQNENVNTWNGISINRRILQCLQQTDILAHIDLEMEETAMIQIIRIMHSE